MKYALCETIEREISEPKLFTTHAEAVECMHGLVRQATGMTQDELDACLRPDGKYVLDDGEIDGDVAYCTAHHDNFDWKIFHID